MLQTQTQILSHILTIVGDISINKGQLEADLNTIVSNLNMRDKGNTAGFSKSGFRDTIPMNITDNSVLISLTVICIGLLFELNQSNESHVESDFKSIFQMESERVMGPA